MRIQILKIASGISLCLMVSGCGIRDTTFYIPVDNQKGDAQPLSKEDTIRVVVPHDFPETLYNNSKASEKKFAYNMSARDETAKRLQQQGYNVVDTGYYPKNDGHPTVIALVDSAPIEGSSRSETRTWDAPVFTDEMGRTTLSEKQGITITHTKYYYKVKLVRPEGADNSLFECNSNSNRLDLCIAPANPVNYKTIFSGYATLSTDNPNPFGNLAYLTGAVFHRYPNPNMLGKRWVYEDNGGYDPICAVEPNTPYPINKNYDVCVVKPNAGGILYRGKQL